MKSITKYPSEDDEQIAFVNWFRMKYKDYIIFAIPNGGNRNILEAAKLKRTGTLKGVPDLCIIMDNGRTIWVEMKRQKNGTLSSVQKEMHSKMNELGHDIIVAYGFRDAVKKIKVRYGI